MSRDRLIFGALFGAGLAVMGGYYLSTLPGAADAQTPVADGPGPNLEIDVAGEANGTIVIDLLPEVAPLHVAQITALARMDAYDNVVFHRVIDGFMAQTGDTEFGRVDGDLRMAGRGGSELGQLAAEFSDIPYERGIVGMARSASPDSANSQFFIMFGPAPSLNGQYTVVGRVIAGMEVVDAIKRGDQGQNGVVVEAPDVMTDVRVIDQ
jgi:peptidylprolyl isomerase